MNLDGASWIEQLAGQYGRMVFGAAFRVLGDPDEAEDVQQEVFLKLLKNGHGVNVVRNWPAYLKVSAVNCATDHLRRRARQRWQGIETAEHMTAPAEYAPDCQAQRNEEAMLLRRSLARLPERDAAVFSLRYFEELTYEEIAAHTGLSASQIGVVLHRSRARLLKLIKSWSPRETELESAHVRAKSSS